MRFGQTRVLDDVSLTVESGELLVILGASGCGKTTLLRLVAGALVPDVGDILMNGRSLKDVPIRARSVAFIMESGGLYTHLDVFSNIAFPLRVRKIEKSTVSKSVHEIAEVLEIDDLLARRPGQLSAGQQQRVAIARALVRTDAAILLADEAFSRLDPRLRHKVRARFKQLQRERGQICLFVTHNQEEALAIGDRIALMRDRRIVQSGTARQLYHEPVDVQAATFVGMPPMNILLVDVGEDFLYWEGRRVANRPDDHRLAGRRRVLLGVRPEAIAVTPDSPGGIEAKVTLVENIEPDLLLHLQVGGQEFLARLAPTAVSAGDRVTVSFALDDVHLFDEESGARLQRS
jgi:multiple sugar transport system ATP-binding protein